MDLSNTEHFANCIRLNGCVFTIDVYTVYTLCWAKMGWNSQELSLYRIRNHLISCILGGK